MSIITEVRREREDLARVLKKHTGIRKIVEDLYPDSAHFIYELLQNAEDTGAREAKFTLSKSGLVFEHNGRPFEEKDIYAITDIGEGTKAGDEDKIGRFGVGFKAVFAYSESPHIWSPSLSFKITELVLPSQLDSKAELGNNTRFEFPFNNPKKLDSIAYEEVNAGLKELTETTLLFLSNLESISWQNETGVSGEIFRVRHSENHFEILKKAGGKTKSSSHFLKFAQPVVGLGSKQQVALAYVLDFLPNQQAFDPEKELAKQLKIISANPGRVAVFFPAEKETSGLRFHLHAPFVPELSRASIKETSANLPLFKQLASLAAESLHHIRDLGLLTTDFLAVLPNTHDSIPKRYEDIRKAIVTEMNEHPLTPTHAKSHAPAKNLLQAKASLKNLLTTDDIQFLVDYDYEPPLWASARALQGTNADRFMSDLAITDWDVEEFAKLLKEKASVSGRSLSNSPYYANKPDPDFMSWLSGKSTEWHQELYALLYDDYLSNAGWNKASYIKSLGNLQIIRLANGEYSIGNQCFFPNDSAEQDDTLPRVNVLTYTSGKKKTQQENAKKFLEEVGVREVGEAEEIEAILKQRYVRDSFKPLKQDLKRFISLIEKEPDKAKLFSSYFIFERPDGKWSQPSQFYLDKPFIETGLSAYYNALGQNASRVALAESYQDCGVSAKRLAKFAEAVGVQISLGINNTKCKNNPKWSYLKTAPGNIWTSSGKDLDYEIDGLEKIFKQTVFDNLPFEQCLAISKLIWKLMSSTLPSNPDYLKATFSYNKSNAELQVDSILIQQLSNFPWIAQGDKSFARPAEATRELLPDGFQFDQGWQWLKAIHFGEEAIKKSEVFRQKQSKAQELGFESADRAAKWAELEKLGVSPDELIAQYRKRELPDKEPVNPERRATKIITETRSSPEKTKEFRERSIDPEYGVSQDEARTYLKHQYTDDDGLMFCQLCKAPQPVMLNGNPHFEAVTCVADMNKHTAQNNLALCPNHAAMYKKSDLTPDIIQQAILDCEEQTIPLNLAGNQVELYFTQQHIRDLQATLRALQDSEI